MRYPVLWAVFAVVSILVCAWGQEATQSPKPATKVEANKFSLSKEEEKGKELLQTKYQLMQLQIKQAVQDHQAEVNAYVVETLKAHGNPKDVQWDSVHYEFVFTPEAKEPVKPESGTKPPPKP